MLLRYFLKLFRISIQTTLTWRINSASTCVVCIVNQSSTRVGLFSWAREGSNIPPLDGDVTSQLDRLERRGQCWRFVSIAFDYMFGPHDDITRWFRRPTFNRTVTPQSGDPAKMKWMFKEDHSLGKGVWIVIKEMSCHATSFFVLHSASVLPFHCALVQKCMLAPSPLMTVNLYWLTLHD